MNKGRLLEMRSAVGEIGAWTGERKLLRATMRRKTRIRISPAGALG
jgi:hypothetical protein